MASHLDLEEQEQLDQLKHFWNRWGTLITWVMIVVFGSLAAWNGYQFWERRQAAQASVLYDEVDRAAQAGDAERVQRAFGDIRDRFGSTAYASQAGLLAGKTLYEKDRVDDAKAAFGWVADKSKDEGYKALARLRLAAVLLDAKAYDDALRQLAAPFPTPFSPLAADRKGDVLQQQGKKAEAAAEYTRAWNEFGETSEYRRLVEIKLNALGVDPRGGKSASAAAGVKP